MPSPKGAQLSQTIKQKVEELKSLCQGLDEKTASRAPAGRWSPKQILSHLCGPEGGGFLPTINLILEQDNPRLDIEAENPFYTGKRSQMTLAELLKEFEREYGRLADLASGLSETQLSRKVHIPLFKETPMGEHLTLAMWIGGLGEHHMRFHIDHMREILGALGVGPAGTESR